MVKIELSVKSFVGYAEDKVKNGINNALVVLRDELQRLTPEDTKEMLNSYVTEGATKVGGDVVGSVGNTAEHSIYVEYGAGRAYNYHKPKGKVAYTGVGNRTFARAVDNKAKEIYSIIDKALGEQ